MTQPLPADGAQAQAMSKLEARTFPEEPWTPNQIAAHLRRPDAVALVLPKPEGTRLVGAAYGWCAGGVAELLRISVDPKARRKGHGKVLLEHFIAACVARGADEVWLEVRADNRSALSLYEARGFLQTGMRTSYYPDGQTAILMTLRPGEVPEPAEPQPAAEAGSDALTDGILEALLRV